MTTTRGRDWNIERRPWRAKPNRVGVPLYPRQARSRARALHRTNTRAPAARPCPTIGARDDRSNQRRHRMQYFVTGATGFIGKRLVKALLARRGATVHFLLRPGSEGKVPDLLAYWGAAKGRAIPVMGDLTGKKLGVAADQIKALKGTHRPDVPPGRGVRPGGRRGVAGRRQRRGHAQRGRVRQGDRRQALQPRVVDRGRRPVRRRVPRGHVRRGREPRPPVLRHQARVREDRAHRVQGALDGVPPGDGGGRLARPARWTRSTARTTSSS